MINNLYMRSDTAKPRLASLMQNMSFNAPVNYEGLFIHNCHITNLPKPVVLCGNINEWPRVT